MLAALCVLLPVNYALGQNANSGEIKGTVTDTSGAVIPGVAVNILNVQTGVTIKTVTNGDGIYDVPSVPPGDYGITFSKLGFRDAVHNGITLQVATIGINAVLQVGAASQQVIVTANAPLLQTEDSSQHTDFDTEAVQNAPIVGGVWYNELTNELPGVNGGGGQDASGQGIGVNGTQGYSGSFLIEGSTATEPRDANASDNYPPVDAIGEVNVQTSNFGTEYGNGVATFNALLKSGTNRFHGSAFEFIQNDAFNARNYFNPAPGTVAPERWNEFGGSVGGPIIRDKLFFYFTFQDNPNTSSGVYTTTVPTQGANGTTNMDAGCFPGPVTNPSTGSSYANNCITSAFDPVAINIQKYFPAPNLPGYSNNYRVTQTNPSTSKWYVGKIDYTPSQTHHLSASYMDYPIGLVNSIDAFCSLGFDCTKGNNYNEDGQVTDVWTINSKMVNEARIGGVREVDKYIPPTYDKGYPTTIGLEPTYGANAPADIFPTIKIDNGGGIGGIGINGGVHAALEDGALVESDVFTLIKGKHTLKMGGEFDKSYQNYTSWGDVSSGNFEFNGVSTGVPYADFLLGDVYGWYVYDYVETGARSKSAGAFIQDNYQVSEHLAVNAGLRYQFQGGWGEVQNRWGTFNPDIINTGQYAPANTLGAMSYGGQDGRNNIQNSDNEWAPRIGLSWSPLPKWAFRASYGITDQPWSVDPYSAAYGVGLNPHGSQGYGNTAVFQLKNGPAPGSVAYPTLSNLSNSQFNYDDVNYYPEHRPATYYQETLFSVQHELPGQMLLDLSYVFTKGTHLGFSRDINQVPQGLMPGYATGAYSSCYNDPSAYPLFCSVGAVLFDGYSNYNALQLRAEKRFSHGLSFIFNYAYSKTMDTGTGSGNDAVGDVWQNAFNVPANYSLSTLDMRNSINGSATYELPFGKGRLVGLHGIADEALGGWRATGVFQIHSGIPYTPTTSNNGQDDSGSEANNCGCGYSWLPNVVGNPSVSHKGFNPNIDQWYNPTAFATPATGTFGNERRTELIGPNWRDLDLSLGKTFRLIEGVQLEIRADSFNALNHPNFEQPSDSTGTGVTTDLPTGTSAPQQITSANGARSIQLGGRFTF
jgi:hypothetical protein